MAQIISSLAVTIFVKLADSYKKRPGLTVVGGIIAAVIVSVIIVPEKPKKLTAVEAGQEFLRKHIPENILEDADQNSINWTLGKVFFLYCFGEYKSAELPLFLSKESHEKIVNWRSRNLNAKDLAVHLEELKNCFGRDTYDDSGNALFTEIKGISHFEHKASTDFMQAWAAIRESDNV